MRQLTIAIVLLMVIALQSALRAVWQPLAYIDLALILVVYFALRRPDLADQFREYLRSIDLEKVGSAR